MATGIAAKFALVIINRSICPAKSRHLVLCLFSIWMLSDWLARFDWKIEFSWWTSSLFLWTRRLTIETNKDNIDSQNIISSCKICVASRLSKRSVSNIKVTTNVQINGKYIIFLISIRFSYGLSCITGLLLTSLRFKLQLGSLPNVASNINSESMARGESQMFSYLGLFSAILTVWSLLSSIDLTLKTKTLIAFYWFRWSEKFAYCQFVADLFKKNNYFLSKEIKNIFMQNIILNIGILPQ